MNRIIPILAMAIFATGCETVSTVDCGDANGVDMQIRYGDSSIEVSHRIKVKRKDAILIKLHPQINAPSGTDYKNMEIEIRGEKRKDRWLNKKITSTDDKKTLRICVKEDQKPGDYKYLVIVPTVGTIDPRVEVEPD
jgi:hypothetical protein